MKRWLRVFLFLLVLGLQAPPPAFAATSSASPASATATAPDCHTAAKSHKPAAHTCCTDDALHSSCCTASVLNATALTLPSGLLLRHGRPPQGSLLHEILFSSRGESPLIRPPIL